MGGKMADTKVCSDFSVQMSEQVFEYELGDIWLNQAKDLLANHVIDDIDRATINELFINNNPLRLDRKDHKRLSLAFINVSENTSDWELENKFKLIEGRFNVEQQRHENAYFDYLKNKG